MNVKFQIEIGDNESTHEIFSIDGEWGLPCLPKQGEKIHTLVFINQSGFCFKKFKNTILGLITKGAFKDLAKEYKSLLQEAENNREKEKDVALGILDDWLTNIVSGITYLPAGKDGTSILPVITIE